MNITHKFAVNRWNFAVKVAFFGSFASGDISMASPAANGVRFFISSQNILSERSRYPIFAIFDVFRQNFEIT